MAKNSDLEGWGGIIVMFAALFWRFALMGFGLYVIIHFIVKYW